MNKVSKVLTLAFAIIATISLCLSFGAGGANFAFATVRRTPIYRVQTAERAVSLTFDAAWGADKTLGILDILDSYNIKATFFLVSFWMTAHPELVVEIARRGHEIGTHSATHPKMSQLSEAKMQAELASSCKLISDLTGRKVQLFRPPFGDYNNCLLDVCGGLGLYAIQWDVDSLDWKGLTAEQIALRMSKAKNGSIILFHNNSDHILKALPLVIEILKAQGLHFKPVGELIYYSNYDIDNSGCQYLTNNQG